MEVGSGEVGVGGRARQPISSLRPTPYTPLPTPYSHSCASSLSRPLPSPNPARTLPPSMPSSYESFGRGPMWEAEGGETSPTLLEQPQPQPITPGFRGKVAVVTGG